MTRDDLRQGWMRLRGVYDRMPDFDTVILGEWLRVLQPYSGADLDAAISMWVSNKRWKPSPADLASYCRKAQNRRREAEIEEEIAQNGECAFCGGTGFVWHFLEPDDRDRVIYCQCARSPDREKGAKILSAACADDAWVFDKKAHGFRRRRAWVGDEPVMKVDQSSFWKNATARVGRSL